MIYSYYVDRVAKEKITERLKTVPGALTEILEPGRWQQFTRMATERMNNLDIYAYSRGYNTWDVDDAIEKIVVKYAHQVLDAMEHNVTKID